MFVQKLSISVITAALVAASVFQSPAVAQAVTFVSLQSGHSTIVPAEGLTRVAVGDGRIAGALTVGTTQVVINAKSAGHTTVTIWAHGVRTNYEVTVTEQGSDDLARVLRSSIHDPGVNVISVGRSIVVRGTVTDGSQYAQISSILDRFKEGASAEKLVIVNALAVSSGLATMQSQLAQLGEAKDVHVESDGKGSVIVSGQVRDRTAAQSILDRARRLAGAYLATDGKIVDRLEIETTSQIDVKVYVLEIDQTGLKQLGVRLQGAFPDPDNPRKLVYTQPQFPVVEDPSHAGVGKSLTIGGFFRSVLLAPTIDAILQTGHGALLSSPSLVTMPGEKASFLVGGEVPYIYSTALGQTNIVFKDYGVKLEITPTILGSGAIATRISPEISELDFQNGIQLNGFTIPALKTSRLSTALVTQPGESIIMGGLLKRVDQRNITKVPGLGDVPVLGQLFRSQRYQTAQTDVIFVMTPQIVTR